MANTEISRVAFRAPQIWKSDITLWFFQVESSFKTAGIKDDETKFHCVIAALDTEILSYVRDIVQTPPANELYETLKNRIVNQFAQSEASRLRSLLQEIQLGDKRPSKLLHEMRALATDNVSEEILRTLWLQRLPTQIQQILSISKDKLDDLAKIADKITEVSVLGQASAEYAQGISAVDFQSLRGQISDLADRVEQISRSRSFSKRGRRKNFRSKSRSKSRERNDSNAKSKPYCWYHFKFGKNAKRCIGICKFSENT